MNPIVGWIIGILSVVLLGTVIDLLLGEKRIGKYIKSIFAAVTILVIILPVPGILRNGIDFNNPFIFQNEFTLDENFLNFADRVKLRTLAAGVERQLEADGVRGARVTIEGRVEGAADIAVERVRINLENAVIEGKPVHIHRNEHVGGLVAQYLDIDFKRIIVYDG